MILYFSATGNCKYAATRIAEATGDSIVSIVDCMRDGRFSFEADAVGIVSPTYDLALPSITREFLQKAEIRAKYVYYIATYGTTPGASAAYAEKYLGRKIDAFFSVRMPDTWTPVFDLSTPEKVAAFSTTTEADIHTAIRHIKAGDCGQYMSNRLPVLIAATAYPFYELNRRTKNLHAEDTCIGCGLCAGKCPVQAIEIREKKPVWVKEQCVMCLGCLHRCPKFAIHYKSGRGTKAHGQYVNPHVKL